jgi:hypothetical protein
VTGFFTFPRSRFATETQSDVPGVVEFAREALGFEPDERQAEVLRSTAKRGILNCTRQWGKSTVAGIKALHRAHTRPGVLVIVASPTERQSGEFLRKAEVLLASTGVRPRGDGKNPLSLLLPNGSRIVGLPGTEGTVRGFSSVSLMVIDEAARVPDEVYKALRPMLAVEDGDLWLLSTPAGKQGFFYENWEHGGEEWERVTVRATEWRKPDDGDDHRRGARSWAGRAMAGSAGRFTGGRGGAAGSRGVEDLPAAARGRAAGAGAGGHAREWRRRGARRSGLRGGAGGVESAAGGKWIWNDPAAGDLGRLRKPGSIAYRSVTVAARNGAQWKGGIEPPPRAAAGPSNGPSSARACSWLRVRRGRHQDGSQKWKP